LRPLAESRGPISRRTAAKACIWAAVRRVSGLLSVFILILP